MAQTLTESWSARVAAEYGVASPRVVLADGDDPRVRSACPGLLEAGVTPVLLGTSPARLPQEARYVRVDQEPDQPVEQALRQVAERRHWDEARLAGCLRDPQYLAAAMVAAGQADAAVAGATAPTGAVLRAALQVIGLDHSASLLSSCFLIELVDGHRLAFGDCAVVPSPDAPQLADIAAGTAATYRTLTGDNPSVALLSFSTHGSASHPDVDLVREATRSLRERHPYLQADGDLQFDAAFDATVAAHKAPGSPVAGRANVFIFPNLAAGNIGYKIAQRLGGARAYGPILQGLAEPMNDLSRGCSTADVVNVALIGALQAA